jgi:hypothetical protein
MSDNKVCFIIAHKYFRGYESYLRYYIDNIHRFYPDALTIVVDNNSVYVEDVFSQLREYDNVILLENDIKCKFELGAYQVGMRYLIENDLLDEFSYCICTQDNFVLKNKYDFDALVDQNRYALPINSMYADGACRDVCDSVLNRLGMNDNWDKINFCWCSSFVLASSRVRRMYGWLTQIVQTVRWESEGAERYLARLLWELNDRRDCGDIDGSAADLHVRHYDTWRVNIHDDATSYFVKKVQQKNEHTKDSNIPQKIVHIPSSVNKANYDRGK